jgi:hypothetical protein
MTPTTVFEELAIAVSIKNCVNHSIHPEFLEKNGIVPSNWKLQESPILEPHMTRVQLKNNLNSCAL